jgi:hypothetical protein
MTGKPTIEELDSLMPPLPDDDPIYEQGWIVGQTFSGSTPSATRALRKQSETEEKNRASPEPSQDKLQVRRSGMLPHQYPWIDSEDESSSETSTDGSENSKTE